MEKHKHLTLTDRIIIEKRLVERVSFRGIAAELAKDPSTISKEVKGHLQFKQSGCYGKSFNNCRNRMTCAPEHLCGSKRCKRSCKFCSKHRCSRFCPDFQAEICRLLASPPYVCNGCRQKTRCSLEKRLYSATRAQKEYEEVRSEARQGLQISCQEAQRLDAIISPLLKKGQSLHHICIHHKDEIMCHERTLYQYVSAGIFSVGNMDMPRVVRMGRRRPKKNGFKVDRRCREKRTYLDYKQFMAENPGLPVVEMDTLEGLKGGKVLLTIHFTVPQFMLAFIRDANTSKSVIDIFNHLVQKLGAESFRTLFPVLLADNGSEFSNPYAIETDPEGSLRSRVFYCDPQSPYQKPAVENNHTFIRRIIPKGKSLNHLTQDDIQRVMNHVNSYSRKNLGDKSPWEIFAALYGEHILKEMDAELVPADKVTLHPSLLK